MRLVRAWPLIAALTLAGCQNKEKSVPSADSSWRAEGIPVWFDRAIRVRGAGDSVDQAEKAARDCGVAGILLDGDLIGPVLLIRPAKDGEPAVALACFRDWLKAHPEFHSTASEGEAD
jgi:hypothetical protein